MCLSPADMDVPQLKRHLKMFKKVSKSYKDRGLPVPDYRKRHQAMLEEQLAKRKAEKKAGKAAPVPVPRHVNSAFDEVTAARETYEEINA